MTIILAIAAACAVLLAAIVAMIARSERPADVAQADEFKPQRAALFTDDQAGRHRHDTVEMVALDYLIPRAYATEIAPRLLDAQQAAQG